MTSFQQEKNAYWRHEGELSIFADEIFPVEMASVMFLPQHSDTRGMFYLFCEITNVLSKISLFERYFLSEYREMFYVIFILY